MNAHTTIAAEAEEPAVWAQAMLRRQVERLDALAQLGLDMAQAIAAEKADGAVTAFSRVAKVVRLTGLLQSKLIKDMDDAFQRAQRLAPEREAQARIAATQRDPAHDHKARVERIAERQLKALHGDDGEQVERLMLEACERLDDDDIYRDVINRPVGELVARICQDLGVEPDWERLAEEAWAQEEMQRGVEGSPFNNLDTGRALPFSAENGGEDPLAERSEERVGVGEGILNPPFDRVPERPNTWSG